MYKLEVRRTCIIINNYNWNDSKKLQDFFAIYDPIYHTVRYFGLYYDEIQKRLMLPRGIDVSYIESLLGVDAYFIDKYNEYDKIDIRIKYKPRDDRQVESLKFMVGEGIQYKHNKYKPQLAVNLPTGAGKTYCTIASASYLQQRTGIITSSLSWLEQWKSCILDYTDTRPNEIYFMAGVDSIKALLRRNQIEKYKFILISIQTLKSYGDKYGWDKITELFKFMRLGIKAYDECHTNFESMSMIDYYTSVKTTYYITATLARSDKDENKIYQLYFKNIPSISLFNEDKDPHTHYIGIKYNTDPSPQEISKCRNNYGFNNKAYSGVAVTKINYYRLLDIIIDIGMHKDGKVLIYIATQFAIEKTYEYLYNKYEMLRGNIGIFTSKVKSNKKEQLSRKFILTTTKSCGAAVNIKGLVMTVVLAEPFNSEVTAKQTIGRTRAEGTFYFDCIDTGFKRIGQYYYEKKPLFNKYALDCSEIKLINNLEEEWSKIRQRQIQYPMGLVFMPEYVPPKVPIEFGITSPNYGIKFDIQY